MKKKILKRVLLFGTIFSLIFVEAWYRHVTKVTEDHIYTSSKEVTKKKVGVLLGTARKLQSGYDNLYFNYRIDKAAQAYHDGKVDFLLVSGDNHTSSYNEPLDMKEALMAKGVPAVRIELDCAGFRTLDSVVRCKEVFGESSVMFISQKFHNERAVYIARHYGMDASGLDAEGVSKKYGWKVMLRERFARVLMFVDLYVLNTTPKFLGDPIQIGE